eukprot:TRINITY_DN58331_c0_g1_i1.p1 TRINITY_DN58331_c0_g1~~TRINITY_DN58331_c0_g1_i1.p1  ORF type:complete len:534 (+),score=23.79 TRINITY_DN58331_c0_g1_i1:52-1653(+)
MAGLGAPLIAAPPAVAVQAVRTTGRGRGACSAYPEFVQKYGKQFFVVDGEAKRVRHVPGHIRKAVSVLEFVYLPYFVTWTFNRMTSTIIYQKFVSDQLGLGIEYIGYISLSTDIFSRVMEWSPYSDWVSKVPRYTGAAISILFDMTVDIGMSVSQNWVMVFISQSIKTFSPDSNFGTFRRHLSDKEDLPTGATLQVGVRYITVACGVPLGLLLASRMQDLCPWFGAFRGAYVISAAGRILLFLWVYWAIKQTHPECGALGRDSAESIRTLCSGQFRRCSPCRGCEGTKWGVLSRYTGYALNSFCFSFLTELVRSTWSNTMTLKAISSVGISTWDCGQVQVFAHLLSAFCMWMTPMLMDFGGVRGAAVPSFGAFAIAHYLLAESSSFYLLAWSGLAFSCGEAMSCGLRENVNMNNRLKIRDRMQEEQRTRAEDVNSRTCKQAVDTECKLFDKGVAALVRPCTMLINFLIPWGGHRIGMNNISHILCGCGCLATVLSLCFAGKPPVDSHHTATRESEDAEIVHCPCSCLCFNSLF